MGKGKGFFKKTKKGNSTYVSVLDRIEIREIKAKKNSEAERKLDKLFLKMLIVLDRVKALESMDKLVLDKFCWADFTKT